MVFKYFFFLIIKHIIINYIESKACMTSLTARCVLKVSYGSGSHSADVEVRKSFLLLLLKRNRAAVAFKLNVINLITLIRENNLTDLPF